MHSTAVYTRQVILFWCASTSMSDESEHFVAGIAPRCDKWAIYACSRVVGTAFSFVWRVTLGTYAILFAAFLSALAYNYFGGFGGTFITVLIVGRMLWYILRSYGYVAKRPDTPPLVAPPPAEKRAVAQLLPSRRSTRRRNKSH